MSYKTFQAPDNCGKSAVFVTLGLTVFLPLCGQVQSSKNRVPLKDGESFNFVLLQSPPKKPSSKAKKPTPPPPPPIEEPTEADAPPISSSDGGEAPRLPTKQAEIPAPNEASDSEHYYRLTPLEVQAAIFRVCGLPDPFTKATFQAPSDGVLEFADSLIFVQAPKPLNLNCVMSKQGLPSITRGLALKGGYARLEIPSGYDGCTVDVTASRVAVVYLHRPLDAALDHSVMVRRLVGPSNSNRRVGPVYRPNVRLDILPGDPQALATHPDTKKVWAGFLALAKDMHI